jgi:hypothetical protein
MAKARRTGPRAEANSAGEEEATSASSLPSSSRGDNIAEGVEGAVRQPKRNETVDDDGLSTMAVVMLILALVFGGGAVILAREGFALRVGIPSRGHERSESRIEPTRYVRINPYMCLLPPCLSASIYRIFGALCCHATCSYSPHPYYVPTPVPVPHASTIAFCAFS